MPTASADRLISRLGAPDPRFAHPLVKPLPRWSLLICEIFDLLDTDQSGLLDLGEYMQLATMGASPFSFMLADKDNSGSVDKAEFLAVHLDSPAATELPEGVLEGCCIAMKQHLQSLKPMPKSQLDRPALLTKLFQVFDSDGDGEMDYEEFQRYSTTDEMQLLTAKWFSFMDGSQGDGDGKVSLQEWLKGMGMLNQHLTDMKFEAWLMDIVHHVKSVRASSSNRST